MTSQKRTSKSTPRPKPQKKKARQYKKYVLQIMVLFVGAFFLGSGLFFLMHPEAIKTLPNLLFFFHKKNTSFNYATYQQLSHHLTYNNKAAIEEFLKNNPNSSLSITLRNRWLIYLAEEGHWKDFLEDYRPTNDQAVECYYLQALYYSGKSALALSGVKRLWLAGYKPSPACSPMFSKWRNSNDFKEEYLWPRIQLAIQQNDLPAVKQLAQSLSSDNPKLALIWFQIHENPALFLPKAHVPDNALGHQILLDGLTQWANLDVEKAVHYWKNIQSHYHLDEASTQKFYLVASLHFALKGDPQAEIWFAKILPQYSTPQSRAWQVRFALLHQNWANVLARIQTMPLAEQENIIWQYWKARALQATGQTTAANRIFQKLSTERQYYGFLSAYQLHQKLSIQQKNYPQDKWLLIPYKQSLAQIQQFFQSQQKKQALQLTQDLLNRLNPVGQYTLANLFFQWGWFAEAMNIANRSPYQSDLKLRFPMPHQSLIVPLCQKEQVSTALVYAIARQESNFHTDVDSAAGGRGILQLTLTTAQQFLPKLTQKDLYDPETNIQVSVAYLKKLTQQFGGNLLLVTSAYNAGPQKTRTWQYSANALPADIWIETRPWEETRNYMKNVLAYTAVYQYLLGQNPDITAFMPVIK